MDAQTHTIVSAAYGVREGARDLQAFYTRLASRGLLCESATIDGNPQQMKYLQIAWPSIILQRCVVHVQRQGLSWCRRTPKRTDTKHLRNLFLVLTEVKTETDRRKYVQRVLAWEQRFGSRIVRSSTGGWVFSDLVRARSMLLKALPDLFHFLVNKSVPNSTNPLEGYFARLKEKYRCHRGLAPNNRQAYFQWYFHLQPR